MFYVGTYLTPRICDGLLPEIESVRRLGDGCQFRFLINHADHEVKLESLPPGELLLGENRPEFAPYEVKVIKS